MVVHTPLRRTGWFTSSHDLLNQLHENTVWSMRDNFVGVPSDCPQRDERLGWAGDINAFAPTAVLLHDSQEFLRNWLTDLRLEQAAAGSVPWIVPNVMEFPSSPTALWSDVAVSLPWTLYQEYGDVAILHESYSSMAAFTRQVEELLDQDGLWSTGFQYGDWLDPDAPADNPSGGKTDRHLVATGYFYRVAWQMAETARIVGEADDAAHFARLAQRVRSAFLREYVTGSGRMADESATAYALAICFGILQADQVPHAGERLADLVAHSGYTISTGFAGTPYVCPALAQAGQWHAAYQLLLQTHCPSFLFPITKGATTIWERWDAIDPEGKLNEDGMTSLNHYALGAITSWLYTGVAGLERLTPGWGAVRFAPHPGGKLTMASARHITSHGEVACSWALEASRLEVTVTVPHGVHATLVNPFDPEAPETVVPEGTHHYSFALPEKLTQQPERTMDTPLSVLANDPEIWTAVTKVFAYHLPGIPIDGSDPQAAAFTLNTVLQYIPGAKPELRHDLEEALADPGYAETLHDHQPAGPEVEEAALLSGTGFWTSGIPETGGIITFSDGPHGVRRQEGNADHLGITDSLPATCFPAASVTACSFDPELLYQVGRALGEEADSLGVDVLLGPAINIKRSPLCGRNFEYFSEDPLLTGVLATAWTQGLQSTGVGASVKHFAANNQETDRMQVSAEVDERTLREIYLPAFERVIRQAQPATVMASYNAINGTHACENRWLLTDVLRGEWGFDGAVVSDWGAVKDRVAALKAGLDLEMPGPATENTARIVQALQKGDVSRSELETAVERLTALGKRVTARTHHYANDFQRHHSLARKAAAESIVLLRNQGQILPLKPDARLAVIGEFAVDPQFQGGGSSHTNPTRVDKPLDALRESFTDVHFAPGYSAHGSAEERNTLLQEAREAARSADVAIVFAGVDEDEQSEGFDRSDLNINPDHVAVIEAVAQEIPTVVVLFSGGIVTLEPWHDAATAILFAGASGQACGTAIADVLTGRINPSGHLAETIPYALQHTPSFLNFPGDNHQVRYGEGVFVGYRYFTSADRSVRYPFGYGLSFTTFAWSDFTVDPCADGFTASVTVTNTGNRSGADVVQMYVRPPACDVHRPLRELAGFKKVFLEPGEHQRISIVLPRRAFSYWSPSRHTWWLHGGDYGVEWGRSATDIVHTITVDVAGDKDPIRPLTVDSSVKEWFTHPIVGPVLQQALMANATAEQTAAAHDNANALAMVESMSMSQFAHFPGVDLPTEYLDELVTLSHQQ